MRLSTTEPATSSNEGVIVVVTVLVDSGAVRSSTTESTTNINSIVTVVVKVVVDSGAVPLSASESSIINSISISSISSSI